MSPITAFKNILTGASIIGMIGFYAGYELTKKTIGNVLGETQLVATTNSLDPVWDNLTKKINEESSAESGEFTLLKRSNETVSKDKLMGLCSRAESLFYKTMFISEDKALLSDVKKFCSISIKEMIGKPNESNIFSFKEGKEEDSDDKTEINKKIEELKKKDGDSSNKLTIPVTESEDPEFKAWLQKHVDEELDSLRRDLKISTTSTSSETESGSSDNDNWKIFLKWCQKMYDLPYLSTIEPSWVLASHYCKKTSD